MTTPDIREHIILPPRTFVPKLIVTPDICSHDYWERTSGVVIWYVHECPGWSFDMCTNVRPCKKSCVNECPCERLSRIPEPKLTTVDRWPLYSGLVHFLLVWPICLCMIFIYRCYESCSSQNVLHLMHKHGRNKLETTFRLLCVVKYTRSIILDFDFSIS